MSCIFCRIAAGEIPARLVYSDDLMLAFHDLNPQAPVHVLMIPRKHIAHLSEAAAEDHELLGHMLGKVGDIARELGIDEGGYRLLSNCRESAGQSVFHLHFHLLGGRSFHWPPG